MQTRASRASGCIRQALAEDVNRSRRRKPTNAFGGLLGALEQSALYTKLNLPGSSGSGSLTGTWFSGRRWIPRRWHGVAGWRKSAGCSMIAPVRPAALVTQITFCHRKRCRCQCSRTSGEIGTKRWCFLHGSGQREVCCRRASEEALQNWQRRCQWSPVSKVPLSVSPKQTDRVRGEMEAVDGHGTRCAGNRRWKTRHLSTRWYQSGLAVQLPLMLPDLLLLEPQGQGKSQSPQQGQGK